MALRDSLPKSVRELWGDKVPEWVTNATKVYDDDPEHLQDVIGKRELREQVAFVDYHYLHAENQQVKLKTPQGTWAITRDAENDRGDMSTILARRTSVESIGIVQELRGGPFMIQDRDPNKPFNFDCSHWASLSDGAQAADEDPMNADNRAVQIAINTPLERVKIYRRLTPRYARRFLKDYGNKLNMAATNVTPMEIYRCTSNVKAGFSRIKKQNGWTNTGLGSTALEDKEYEYACSLHPSYWPRKTHYTSCSHFYKEAQKISMGSQSKHAGKTMWDAINAEFQQKVDLTNPQISALRPKVFVAADLMLRVLKDEERGPEAIVDILLMMVPTLESLGKCVLLPNGINMDGWLMQVPTEEQLSRLVASMEGSPMWTDATKGAEAVKGKGKAKGTKPHQLQKEVRQLKRKEHLISRSHADEDQVISTEHVGTSVLHHIFTTMDYLLKIDDRQYNKADGFKWACYKGVFLGTVKIQGKDVRGMCALLTKFKASTYKHARLTPRTSDVDFELKTAAALVVDDDMGGRNESDASIESAESIIRKLHEDDALVTKVVAYLAQNNPQLPIAVHVGAANAMNGTLLCTLNQIMCDHGGSLPDGRTGA